MGLAQISVNVTLDTTECPNCGIQFAAPDWFIRSRRQDKQTFYCPNGHNLSWRESEADRLRAKLDEQTREASRQAQRALEAQRERDAEATLRQKAERRLKRVHRGVCPCCNRTFDNLARHMATKHAEPK